MEVSTICVYNNMIDVVIVDEGGSFTSLRASVRMLLTLNLASCDKKIQDRGALSFYIRNQREQRHLSFPLNLAGGVSKLGQLEFALPQWVVEQMRVLPLEGEWRVTFRA